MPARKTPVDITPELATLGVLALLAADRDERIANGEQIRRTEVVLAQAGFPVALIATVLGKKYDTVHNAVTGKAARTIRSQRR